MSELTDEVKLLKEILKWTKFAGMNQLQSVLENTLNTPEKRLAYQLSDGSKGIVEIARLSKVGSTFKLGGLWKEWKRNGLGESQSVQGGDRFKRTFDLEDFGIEVPEIALGGPPSQPPPNTGAAEETTNA